MPPSTPELVADERCVIGEGPLYHPEDDRVYWLDIANGRLYAYDPATGDHALRFESDAGRVGGFTVEADGALLLFGESGAVHRYDPLAAGDADGDGEGSRAADGDADATTVVDPDPDRFRERFNDVIADPEGRVFAGVMPDPEAGVDGELHRLDRDGTFTLLEDGFDIPNGMGFTPDRESLYVTDSRENDPDRPGVIRRYDYDRATGALSAPETFVAATDRAGFPDGLTVDEEGYVWSAFWNGNALVRYSPAGEAVAAVDFEPRKVSSVTFGGPDYADAYVTTAGGDDREREGAGAGSLFRLDPGVAGVPEFRSRIG
jgi:D-xylonolactonase